MTEQEKNELNRKLAEWMGFEPHYNAYLGRWRWESPDGEWDIYFTDSLDACFKWLVPKVHKKQGQVTIESHIKGDEDWEYWASFGCGRSGIFKAETPALALCLAIEKL